MHTTYIFESLKTVNLQVLENLFPELLILRPD